MYLSSSLSKSSFLGSGTFPLAAPPLPPLTAFTLPLPRAGGAVRGADAAALAAAVVARFTPPPRPPLVEDLPRVVAATLALGAGAGALALDNLLGPSLLLAYFWLSFLAPRRWFMPNLALALGLGGS